jgi:hypothetical protein
MGNLRDFAQLYTEAWCSQDPTRVAAFFSPQGWLSVNGANPAVGRAAITETARGFMLTFPDLRILMDALKVKDNGGEYHWTLIGTYTAPGGTSRKVCVSGFEAWTIGPDGLITESRGSFDSAEYQRQLNG